MFVHFGLTRATAHSHMAAHGHNMVVFQNGERALQVRFMCICICIHVVYVIVYVSAQPGNGA